ncbi:hypothetical protein LCGC14_0319940 [marine sediment metagenome]|uniref:Uncharacterized protein n=1 Tax=marine sediment metagenome TaxID=412755 RepID=A0A0F9W6U7_9ZZZZ
MNKPPRRLARVLISHDALTSILTSDKAFRVVKDGIPEGSVVVSVREDWERQVFDAVIEHSSFDLVEAGSVIPVLKDATFNVSAIPKELSSAKN